MRFLRHLPSTLFFNGAFIRYYQFLSYLANNVLIRRHLPHLSLLLKYPFSLAAVLLHDVRPHGCATPLPVAQSFVPEPLLAVRCVISALLYSRVRFRRRSERQ